MVEYVLLLALVLLVAVGLSVLGTNVSDVFNEAGDEMSQDTKTSVPDAENTGSDWRVRLP